MVCFVSTYFCFCSNFALNRPLWFEVEAPDNLVGGKGGWATSQLEIFITSSKPVMHLWSWEENSCFVILSRAIWLKISSTNRFSSLDIGFLEYLSTSWSARNIFNLQMTNKSFPFHLHNKQYLLKLPPARQHNKHHSHKLPPANNTTNIIFSNFHPLNKQILSLHWWESCLSGSLLWISKTHISFYWS